MRSFVQSLLISFLLIACSDPRCRENEVKVGTICYVKNKATDGGPVDGGPYDGKVDDGGAAIERNDGGVATERDASSQPGVQAMPNSGGDASIGSVDTGVPDGQLPDAGVDAGPPPSACKSVTCGAHARCMVSAGTPNGYTCDCEAGFKREGTTCVDIDECALTTAQCHPSANCQNTPGAYGCTCPLGFSGGGTSGIACAPRLALGSGFACGVTADDKVTCWGDNSSGQLGDNTTITRQTAATVTGLENVAMVDTGPNFACALLRDGSVRCWGDNSNLQCGVDLVSNKRTPVVVTGVADAVAIAVSKDFLDPQYACAILKSRAVVCWGNDNAGYLGDGTVTNGSRFQAMAVSGVDNALSIDLAGANCVTGSDGRLRCWGKGAAWDYGATPVPPFSGDLDDVVSVSMGPFVSCGLTTSGSVFCWGTPALQGASIPETNGGYAFAQVDRRAVSLSVGLYHACAVRDTGALICWGAASSPAVFEGVMNAVAVSNFSERLCALLNDGSVKCWDVNSAPRAVPTPAVALF